MDFDLSHSETNKEYSNLTGGSSPGFAHTHLTEHKPAFELTEKKAASMLSPGSVHSLLSRKSHTFPVIAALASLNQYICFTLCFTS